LAIYLDLLTAFLINHQGGWVLLYLFNLFNDKYHKNLFKIKKNK